MLLEKFLRFEKFKFVANVSNSNKKEKLDKMHLYFRDNYFRVEYSFKSFKFIFLENGEKSIVKNLFITLFSI